MKSNLSYYRHETGSHNHWKFKTLRRKFGWAGEGKFWGLNNMIAEAQDCRLDLSDTDKRRAIAIELDFDLEEFNHYLNFLIQECKLVQEDQGYLITGITQECLEEVSKKRGYQREWTKTKGKASKKESNIEHNNSTIEKGKSNIENEQMRGEEKKGNEMKIERGEHAPQLTSEFDKKKYGEALVSEFDFVSNWIEKNTPEVAKMKEPLSIENWKAYSSKYPGQTGWDIMMHILFAMQNYPELHVRNRSAIITIMSWMKKERDETIIQKIEACKRYVASKSTAAA